MLNQKLQELIDAGGCMHDLRGQEITPSGFFCFFLGAGNGGGKKTTHFYKGKEWAGGKKKMVELDFSFSAMYTILSLSSRLGQNALFLSG